LSETKDLIKDHVLVEKLWRRFWNTIEGYKAGQSCIDILKMYFSYRCKENIQEHRRISNTNLSITLKRLNKF